MASRPHEFNIQSAYYIVVSCKMSHTAKSSIIIHDNDNNIIIEKNGMDVRSECVSFRNCVVCARTVVEQIF